MNIKNHLNSQNPMFIDDNSGEVAQTPENKNPDGHFPSDLLKSFPTPLDGKNNNNQGEIVQIGSMKEEIKQLHHVIQVNQENHKQQIIHVETIGMMTKYQLVFIKLETSLNKVATILKLRQSNFKALAFQNINNYTPNNNTIRGMQSQLVYYTMERKIYKLVQNLKRARNRQLSFALSQMMFQSQIRNFEIKVFTDNEQIQKDYINILYQKDQQIDYAKHQIEENSAQINSLRSKENEFLNQIKQQDKHLFALQQEAQENQQFKRTSGYDSNNPNLNLNSQKGLENRIRELENENFEIKEKLNSTEFNVSGFIKEMGELLDSHEVSTNAGSDDNPSLNNSSNQHYNQLEEELDVLHQNKQNKGPKNQKQNSGLINNRNSLLGNSSVRPNKN